MVHVIMETLATIVCVKMVSKEQIVNKQVCTFILFGFVTFLIHLKGSNAGQFNFLMYFSDHMNCFPANFIFTALYVILFIADLMPF